MQQFIYYYKQLYMFRASICPSSGVLGCILILLHMVSGTRCCGWGSEELVCSLVHWCKFCIWMPKTCLKVWWFHIKDWLMHAYIIHTTLLALCYSNMFQPSSGSMNDTFSQPEQQTAVKEQFIWPGCENVPVVLPEHGLLRANTCWRNAVIIVVWVIYMHISLFFCMN